MNKINQLVCATLTTTLLLASTGAVAGQDKRAISGTIACGGNHFNRVGGTEAQRSSYIIRNFGDTPIRIDQMTLFNASGNILFSADGATLPAFRNSTLGPGDNILMPNQSAQILSNDILGESGLGRNARPITLKLDWAADTKTLIPNVGLVRFSRARVRSIDPLTGQPVFNNREERGRHASQCQSTVINKGNDDD